MDVTRVTTSDKTFVQYASFFPSFLPPQSYRYVVNSFSVSHLSYGLISHRGKMVGYHSVFPFESLPVEIIQHILALCIPFIDDNSSIQDIRTKSSCAHRARTTLSLVSRSWNRLLTSTPRAWTLHSIPLNPVLIPLFSPSYSGILPLHLYVSALGERSIFADLRHGIISCLPRCITFAIEMDGPWAANTLLRHADTAANEDDTTYLPSLRDLRVVQKRENDLVIFQIVEACNLEILELHHGAISLFWRLSPVTLQSLRILSLVAPEYPTSMDFLHRLASCTKLESLVLNVDFRSRGLSHDADTPVSLTAIPIYDVFHIQFNKLSHINLSHSNHSTTVPIFRYISTPALTCFEYSPSSTADFPMAVHISTFNAISASLKHLRISSFTLYEPPPGEFVSPFSQLETLTLDRCHISHTFFQSLNGTDSDNPASLLLSRLQQFTVRNCFFDAYTLLEFIRNRKSLHTAHSAPRLRVYITVSHMEQITWHCFKEELAALDIDLQIRNCGRVVQ